MFLPWKFRPCYWWLGVQPPGAHPRAPALLPADAGCRRHGAKAVTSLTVTHGDPSAAKHGAAPTSPQHPQEQRQEAFAARIFSTLLRYVFFP